MYIIRGMDIANDIQKLAEQLVYHTEDLECVEKRNDLLRLPTPALPWPAIRTLNKLLDVDIVRKNLTRRWPNANEK